MAHSDATIKAFLDHGMATRAEAAEMAQEIMLLREMMRDFIKAEDEGLEDPDLNRLSELCRRYIGYADAQAKR